MKSHLTGQINKKFYQKKIIVTGHTGFKGSWLSLWMSELGADVIGIGLDPPTNPSHFKVAQIERDIEDLRIDLRNQKSLSQSIKNIRPDYLFHLAAQPLVRQSYLDPVETYSTNVMGTLHILEAVRKLDHPCVVVVITSDKSYDNVEWVWGYRETDRLGGPDPYSASKAATELVIRSHVRSFFSKDGNIRVGIGRAGNVIGGGDWAEDRIVPDCVRAWSQDKKALLRNPRATRPWQHVLEPLSGYLNLAMHLNESTELHGEAFNFGPPAYQNHSVANLVTQMSQHWDRVHWQDISQKEDEPYESGLLKLNCDKALQHLKWHAIWDFERTVQETVDWYRIFHEKPEIIAEQSKVQIKCYQKDAKKFGLPWAQ